MSAELMENCRCIFPFLLLLQGSLVDVRFGSGDHKQGLHDSGGRDAREHDLSINVGARHERSNGYGSQRPPSGHAPRWYVPVIDALLSSDQLVSGLLYFV